MSPDRNVMSRTALRLAAVTTIALLAAGCSSSTSTKSATTSTTKAAASSAAPETTADTTAASTAGADTTVATDPASDTTEAADTTTVDTTAGGATTDTAATGDTTIPVWEQTAAGHAEDIGKKYTIDCTPNGTIGSIWGTETYTDDSSICTAAVHVGLISVDAGGKVEYEIAAGAGGYDGMDGNGVTSNAYGAWPTSFTFPKAPVGSGTFVPSTQTWDQGATADGLEVGQKIVVDCSTGGHLGNLWGTKIYTSDSSICTAAVFEGLITVDDGGIVVAEIAAGADKYTGSTAHDVTSNDYGPWSLSFTLPADQTAPKDTTTPTT